MQESLPSPTPHWFVRQVSSRLKSPGQWYSQRQRDKIKRSIDVVVSLFAIAFCLPVFAVVSILVSLDGGPILFRQEREGKNGVRFVCLKFRTMVPNAHEVLDAVLAADPVARQEWEEDRKLKADPRVTKVGRYLRKTSIDELPQLVNVLRGDMSLVGPRPIVAAEVSRYGDAIDYYYQCRPGLTGPWQIGGRNDVNYRQRVLMDVDYAVKQSIRRDLRILVKTPIVVLKGNGAS